MLRHGFVAMGTEIELLLDADDASGFAVAEREFQRLESLLSRFRPDSELRKLNEAGELSVGPELLEVTERAVDARESTGGRFDPTVHDAVIAAGYDRSFELLETDGPTSGDRAPHAGGGVDIDRARGRVCLEQGYKLDLGGIAKGWAADRVCSLLGEAGPALVNAGGDIAVYGREWPISVEATGGSITLGLEEGGLATSGRDRRAWVRNGRPQHHLIDPATRLPARNDVLTVTVAATSAAAAEVLATSLFLAGGAEHAIEEADAAGVPAVLVTTSGDVRLSGALL